MQAQDIWGKIQEYIKERVGQTTFETWFVPLKSNKINGQNLVLEAPDNFFKDWVCEHYLGLIRQALANLSLGNLNVEFQINPGLLNQEERARFANFKSRVAEKPRDALKLNSRYTFDNFVIGSSNRFAHAASLAVAESPAKAYNPLFIYGRVGLGKTHLMQAICHFSKARNPNQKICYMPSETFTNELISAIQHRSTQNFRNKYRNTDILVIDDIHFIAGKESTQEEFFHTFNTLYDAHKQIIISSDRPPKEISKLEERLISRFGWGLITDIQPPDLETRVAILKKKVERESVNIPDDVIFFIAQLIKTNIRELEGALIRVIAYSLLEEKSIDLELTKDVLKDLYTEHKKTVSVDLIQHCVADDFGIGSKDLKTKKRNKNVILPRQIAMYISREITDMSLPEIGTFFGGKDHTTILYAYNKIKSELEVNTNLKTRIERLITQIKQ